MRAFPALGRVPPHSPWATCGLACLIIETLHLVYGKEHIEAYNVTRDMPTPNNIDNTLYCMFYVFPKFESVCQQYVNYN